MRPPEDTLNIRPGTTEARTTEAGPRPPPRRAFQADASAHASSDRSPRELDHRIANSLQLAVDFLLFQQAQLADATARKALIEAAERLVAVGHLHRFLCAHDGEGAVDLRPFLQDLAALIGQSTGLHCDTDVESVLVSGEMAQQLGLAVNELAINAAKHGYGAGEPGDLFIQAVQEGHRLRLSVADHGHGLGAGFDVGGAGGLGLNILRAIVRQLGARLEADEDRGARFTLIVPLPAMKPQSRSFAPALGGF